MFFPWDPSCHRLTSGSHPSHWNCFISLPTVFCLYSFSKSTLHPASEFDSHCAPPPQLLKPFKDSGRQDKAQAPGLLQMFSTGQTQQPLQHGLRAPLLHHAKLPPASLRSLEGRFLFVPRQVCIFKKPI